MQGLSGIQSLTAAENNIAQFTGNDLLTFAAETDNVIPGSDDPLVVPAVINYTGNWDIQNGSLLFVGNVQTATGAPATVQLAFAGKVAGVTAGFAYFSDAAGTELAFNVTGQHVFNAGTLTWSSSIGFSAKGFDATVAIADHQQIGDSTLAIQGSLTLTDASGSQPSLQLSLQADYAPDQHGVLVFNAKVDEGGPTPSYDLMLTGTYQYSNLTLTFSIDYTNQAGAPEVSVAVGIQGNKNSIIQFLQVILNISGSDVELKLALTFSVRLQFENGVRVNVAPSAPAPLGLPPIRRRTPRLRVKLSRAIAACPACCFLARLQRYCCMLKLIRRRFSRNVEFLPACLTRLISLAALQLSSAPVPASVTPSPSVWRGTARTWFLLGVGGITWRRFAPRLKRSAWVR